jgi:glycosyltransferase involved in cell wall biosynthesis
MHIFPGLILLLDWIVALAWVTRIMHWLRGVACVPDLSRPEFAPSEDALPLKLSVIVPARDEERAIAACLRSLLASAGVELDIIAVDDRSTDATGNIMDGFGDGFGERVSAHTLRTIHIDHLPDGWMGKTHAMARAAVEATGEWLLFTDGDILFQPDTLARVMAFAERENADHVILYPTMILRGAGERMMMAFLHAMSIWGVRPWKVGDPHAKNDFIGIGAFNLVRRSVYDEVGGWGALRLEVLEDLRMGFTIKRAGYRQRAVFGPDLARLRWAEGALGMVTNMTKNLFALFRFRLVIASLALLSLVPLCLLPLAGLGFGWAGLVPSLLMFGALAVLYGKNRRLGLPGAAYTLSFPAGSALFLFAIARSILATLLQGGVNWRGTFYPLHELRKHAGPLR